MTELGAFENAASKSIWSQRSSLALRLLSRLHRVLGTVRDHAALLLGERRGIDVKHERIGVRSHRAATAHAASA